MSLLDRAAHHQRQAVQRKQRSRLDAMYELLPPESRKELVTMMNDPIEIQIQLLEHIVAVANAVDERSVTQAGGGTFYTDKIIFAAGGEPLEGIWLGWSEFSDSPAVFISRERETNDE